MSSPFDIVKRFELEVAAYAGAPFAVATTSCTMGLFLVLEYWKSRGKLPAEIEIPRRTYVGVAMSIRNAGAKATFRDETWGGSYQLKPLPLYDAARRFTSGMYLYDEYGIGFGHILVTSHHWQKILGVQQGGMILHDDREMDTWLKRARFDGRTEGLAPKVDVFDQPGWHCYLSPEVAAEGLVRLSFLPKHNEDLPVSDYSDLSLAPLFRV